MSTVKLIILDRDGVINQDRDDFVKNAAEWVPLPQSLDAIALLTQYGYTIAIATNQSGLGRKLFKMVDLNAMHNKMHRLINQVGGRIEGIWFCPHTNEDRCNCRKPKSGMIEDILERFGAHAEDTILVGDSLRDLEAITQLGGKAILVTTGKGKQTLDQGNLPKGTQVFENLFAVADSLTEHPQEST